jgi:hypothetical protein
LEWLQEHYWQRQHNHTSSLSRLRARNAARLSAALSDLLQTYCIQKVDETPNNGEESTLGKRKRRSAQDFVKKSKSRRKAAVKAITEAVSEASSASVTASPVESEPVELGAKEIPMSTAFLKWTFVPALTKQIFRKLRLGMPAPLLLPALMYMNKRVRSLLPTFLRHLLQYYLLPEPPAIEVLLLLPILILVCIVRVCACLLPTAGGALRATV